MITALLSGLVIGFVIAVPPGPIGMATIRMGLRHGKRQATKLAIGAGVFDILYCGAAMWAATGIVSLLGLLESVLPLSSFVFHYLIVIAMITYGVLQVRSKPKAEPQNGQPEQARGILQFLKSHGPFLIGIGYAVVNIVNPTFVPALMAMSTFVQNLALFESTLLNISLFSLGFGVGNSAWLITLVRLVLANQKYMTPKFMHRIQQFSGVTLIGFGAFYGIRLVFILP